MVACGQQEEPQLYNLIENSVETINDTGKVDLSTFTIDSQSITIDTLQTIDTNEITVDTTNYITVETRPIIGKPIGNMIIEYGKGEMKGYSIVKTWDLAFEQVLAE